VRIIYALSTKQRDLKTVFYIGDWNLNLAYTIIDILEMEGHKAFPLSEFNSSAIEMEKNKIIFIGNESYFSLFDLNLQEKIPFIKIEKVEEVKKRSVPNLEITHTLRERFEMEHLLSAVSAHL
jgi:hypothetical protein